MRASIIATLVFVFALASCYFLAGPLTGMGPWFGPRDVWDENTKTDMIVYFRPGTSIQEVSRFQLEVLTAPHEGADMPLPAGVSGSWACDSHHKGIDAECLSFKRFVSRKEIRQKAEAWPSVLKVLEDVVPVQVTREDLGL